MKELLDNFGFKSKKSNFERDSFKSLSEMIGFPEAGLDTGHISYCQETELHYVFRDTTEPAPILGKWRVFCCPHICKSEEYEVSKHTTMLPATIGTPEMNVINTEPDWDKIEAYIDMLMKKKAQELGEILDTP